MAGLILKLAPHERVLINGVVMENGDRKSTLKIKTPDAAILRLRDALHPDDATTPVTRAYYTAQLVVSGETPGQDGAVALTPQLAALGRAFQGTAHEDVVASAVEALRRRNFYSVMRTLKPLIEIEKQLLGDPAAFEPALAATMEARA